MRNFFLLSFVIVFNGLFAFEGVIKQSYVNPSNNETQQFTWYISGDKIKLELQKQDGSTYTIIPDIATRSINVLVNKVGEDGKYWYFNVPLQQTKLLADLVFIEDEKSSFDSYEAVDVKLLTERGLLTLQYIPSIDFNTVLLGNYFTDNEEFGALKQINVAKGFPVNSLLISKESSEGTYALKTNSITKKSFDNSFFEVSSNYNLFDSSALAE